MFRYPPAWISSDDIDGQSAERATGGESEKEDEDQGVFSGATLHLD